MPPLERLRRFDREFRRLSRELQQASLAVLPTLIEALRATPPAFPSSLRIKRVQGTAGMWELTHASDGRATLSHGDEVIFRRAAHRPAPDR